MYIKQAWIDIGERLRIARKDNKHSQEAVAAYFGLTRQAIAGWETGATAIGAAQLGDLAKMYGASTDYLIFGLRAIPVDDASMCSTCPNARGIIRKVLGGKPGQA